MAVYTHYHVPELDTELCIEIISENCDNGGHLI